MTEEIVFYGIKVAQPIGDFFVGKINGKKLYNSAKAEVRDMTEEVNKRLGIQRELSSRRVKEISEYVKTSDACFPNSIILSVKEEMILDTPKQIEDTDIYMFRFICQDDTFQIIDGQHRIAGMQDYDDSDYPFDYNVSLFLDMDIEQQAMLFSTININQKKVPSSLMTDLYSMQKSRNAIKSAHSIACVLNTEDTVLYGDAKGKEGGLNNRISSLYSFVNGEYKITQATFVDKVTKYICGNTKQRIIDTDALKTGKKLIYADEKICTKLIFRNMFIDENDMLIARTISNYFIAIRERWPSAWESDKYVLKKTIAFSAFMSFLKDIYAITQKYNQELTLEDFWSVLRDMDIDDEQWNMDNFSISKKGESQILALLRGVNQK